MCDEAGVAGARLREHLFEQRSDGVVPRVASGVWVLVGQRGERWWCKVTSVRPDGAFVARVDNYLVYNPYRLGDEIVLRADHVLDIANQQDCLTFRDLTVTLGLVGALRAWISARETEGSAVRTGSY
ncbi:hypothetical protein OAO87_02350 [bacterium]|nr:hypothetical protein [bacterium]